MIGNRLPGTFVTRLLMVAFGLAALVLATRASFARQTAASAGKMQQAMEPVPALTPFVEEHAHFDFDEKDPDGAIRAALSALGRENAAMLIFQISPDVYDHPGRYDAEILLAAVAEKASRQAGHHGWRRHAERHDHAVRCHWRCRACGAEKVQGARGRIAARRRGRLR